MIPRRILRNTFSREKSLFYFQLWNNCDRRGWKRHLGHDVELCLIQIHPPGKKSKVWYPEEEMIEVDRLMVEYAKDDNYVEQILLNLERDWAPLIPILEDDKEIETVKEFLEYFENITVWWESMVPVFEVPNYEEVSEETRQKFIEKRVYHEKFTEKSNKVMAAFYNRMCPDYPEYHYCLTPFELEDFVKDPEKMLPTLESRRDGCLLVNGEVRSKEDLQEVLDEYGVEFESFDTENVLELTGVTASKGSAKGKVRIILSFGDMKDFQDGEILVTEMTNPDYVPIMKKAAAIVTNEGGLMSHAAIVSRELKIPCVIGTKFGTDVLKDGQEVEVDADNGVVKILE